MLNKDHDKDYIRRLLKKYVEDTPLVYWIMKKIKYKTNKQQQKELNHIYAEVKHILVKNRESSQTKKAFFTVFLNFYRLYKMSIYYKKEYLNNALIISCNNNSYSGGNTAIPKVVRTLLENDYIKRVHGGYSFEYNAVTSWYCMNDKIKDLIKIYVEMKKDNNDICFVDLSSGDCNIRLKKNIDGRKILVDNIKLNKQLRQWDDELKEINEKLSTCNIGISDIKAFKQVYFDKNYEIFLKQYEIERKYWCKTVIEYRKKNPDSVISDKEICDIKIKNDLKRKKKVIKWKTINMLNESLHERYERIAKMGNLYMQLPNINTKRLYRSFIDDWDKGGRHFHIWVQNIPEKCQKYINIDGEPTLNIDICSCHFLLLAAKHGEILTKEKKYYDVGINALTMVKSRKNTFEGRIHDSKEIKKKVKRVVNTLLNAKDHKSFIKSGKDNGHVENELIMIEDKITEEHHYLKEHNYICSGFGVKLQKEESDFIHKVMYECIVKNNINVICMCDGLIVKVCNANKVESIMYKVWKEMGYKVDLLLERKV